MRGTDPINLVTYMVHAHPFHIVIILSFVGVAYIYCD